MPPEAGSAGGMRGNRRPWLEAMTAGSAHRTEEEAPDSHTVDSTPSTSDGNVVSPDRLQVTWAQQSVAEAQGLKRLERQAQGLRVPRRQPHALTGSVDVADRIFSFLTTGAG